jgi:predicted outer membrane repeat protein
MKPLKVMSVGLEGGAAILCIAAAPVQAAATVNVPCSGPAGGPAGLVAAISAANGSGGATINLAAGCTYQLTTANNTSPTLGSNGLPVITSPITLNGSATTIAGNDSTFRILQVSGTGNLTVQGLTITAGNTTGMGGGILNLEGTLTVNHSQVTGNTAQGGPMSNGGGIASGTLGTGPLGTTTLNSSQVNGNTTSGSAGGILNHGGTLALNGSQVNNNTAGNGGGGIASGTGGMGTNSASNLVLNSSQVSGNTANGGPRAGAGGIANGGTATITASQVSGNTAPGGFGGGILNHGQMTIRASSVASNTTPIDSAGDQGGGAGIANLNITPLTGVPNSGVLTISLSQVTGNSATGLGGGILEDGVNPDDTLGPPGGPLTLQQTQVTGNSAAQGGGIFASTGSLVTTSLSRILGNVPNNCYPPGTVPGCNN